jgi:selenocysteine lyase/cysteine desulfurase
MQHISSRDDWDKWRTEFPACAHVVHMNHAGLSPLSLRVTGAIEGFAAQGLHFDASRGEGWEAHSETVRAAIAVLVHASPAEIAFVQNTSAGLSMVGVGLDWRAGDNVVAVADDYPSNVYPWFGLRRWGVETRLVSHATPRFTVDDVAAVIDDRTRLLAVSAVDWQSGFRADLASLAELCRRRQVFLCVDGIQAVGALDIDVRSLGVDCLAAGGHKWLLAPEGCGFLYTSPRLLERLQPMLLGWKSVDDAERYLPYHFTLRSDAAKLEPGTPQHLGIHALGAAVDLLLEVGPRAIEERVLHLTATLAEALRARGATILSPWAAGERSSILTFALGDMDALLASLTRAHVVARIRMNGIRLAPHFYNNGDDIERVIAAVDAVGAR